MRPLLILVLCQAQTVSYTYHNDIVADPANIALDITSLNTAVTVSYDAAKQIYTNGQNACDGPRSSFIAACTPLTIQKLAKEDNSGEEFYDAFASFYSSPTSWDDFILSSFDATGDHADKSDTFRQITAKKSALCISAMAMAHKLEAAIALEGAGARTWDEAFAAYYGVDGLDASYSVSGKRDTDYPDGLQVNDLIIPLFKQGQKALSADSYSSKYANQARDAIMKLVSITFIRNAIKYSYKAKEGDVYSDKYHGEGYTYTRCMLPWIATFAPDQAQIIEDALAPSLTAETLPVDAHCTVKAALEASYEAMGIDCAMVGNWKDYPADVCDTTCSVPAATAIPEGIYEWGNYPPIGEYEPTNDVVEHSEITDDIASFNDAIAVNYETARDIYTNGQNSVGQTLQDMARADRSGEEFYEAYKAFYGSGTSWDDFTLEVLDGTGVHAGKSDTLKQIDGKKAVLSIMVMETAHHLENALNLGTDGGLEAWDLAWASYHGSSGDDSPFAVSGKRDTDYGATGIVVNERALSLWKQGQKALNPESYSATMAREAYDGIMKLMTITFVRNAIKYSYKINEGGIYSDKYHGEGYTYTRSILGWISKFDQANAQIIEDALALSYTSDTYPATAHCAVKEALEAAYPALGIDCTMVGDWKDYPTTDTGCNVCAAPLAPALPEGSFEWGNFAPIGDYAPTSNVAEESKISTDVASFEDAIAVSYTTASDIYETSLHSAAESLKDLATADRTGEDFYDAYASFYGSGTSWDDFMVEVLEGTGSQAGKSDTFRQINGKKIALSIMVMEVAHQLELAVTLGKTGGSEAWDRAWAYYHGTEGANAPYSVSGKRDTDYGATGLLVNPQVLTLFKQGAKALAPATYSGQLVLEAKDAIMKLITITFVRNAIKYSYKANEDGVYSDKYHGEGYTYTRSVLGWISKFAPDQAQIIEDALAMSFTSETYPATAHCTVKGALEAAYPLLGIDCDMVGVWKDYPETSDCTTCEAPAALAIPQGSSDWSVPPIGAYQPTTYVIEEAEVSDDLGSFTTAIATNYDTAKTVYVDGLFSEAGSLQDLARADRTGEEFYDAYAAFYGSGTSWDDFTMANLDGTGDLASKSDTLRQINGKKAALSIMVMESAHWLEQAIILGADGGAAAWDKAWAFYHGTDGNSAYAVSGKRDTDYPEGIQVNDRVIRLFKQGQRALESDAYHASMALEAKDAIMKLITITFIRNAIKYSYKAKDGGVYSDKYHGEGYTYTRSILGWISKFDSDSATIIENAQALSFTADTYPENSHCTVVAALETTYPLMGIDCTMVGIWKDHPEGTCPACAAPAADAIPEGVFEWDLFPPIGDYEPTTDVMEHAKMSDDIGAFNDAVAVSYVTAQTVYTSGQYSDVGNLQTLARADRSGEEFYEAYKAFYGSGTSWDDFMTEALEGTGGHAGKSDTFRQIDAKKAAISIAVMETAHWLEEAVALGNVGGQAAWDKAWAYYHGTDGMNVGFSVSGKRDTDYGETGIMVNDLAISFFKQGKKALDPATYNTDLVLQAKDNILKLMTITFIRNSIKYSYKIKEDGVYSDKYHGEGYTYTRSMLGWISKFDAANAQIVEDALAVSYTADTFPDTAHCTVKQALEAAYPALGIDCAMVGVWKDYPETDTRCNMCTAPAADPIPEGVYDYNMYPPIGGLEPIYDVTEDAQISEDVAALSTAVAVSYITALDLYTTGQNSDEGTLQDLATADHTGEAFFDAYSSFYGSGTSWDDFTLDALNGNGNMAGKSDAFRQICVKKAAVSLQLMESAHQLEEAVTKGSDGGAEAWDKAWAYYHGTDGVNAPFAVSGKRDTDYPDGTMVSDRMLRLFNQGQQALYAARRLSGRSLYDSASVEEAFDGIMKLMTITSIRNAIKYSYKANEGGVYSDKYHGEGYTYTRMILGYISKYAPTEAQTIEDALSPSYTSETLPGNAHCTVKAALEAAYPALGLDCTMIGEWKDYPAADYCGSACSVPLAPPLPEGVFDEQFESDAEEDDGVRLTRFCSTGEQFNGVDRCEPCRAGFKNPQSAADCTPCDPGMFTSEPGQKQCTACDAGWYAPGDFFTGNTVCLKCGIGSSAPATGMSMCVDCPAGTFSDTEGLAYCTSCSSSLEDNKLIGKYQDEIGQTDCKMCPLGRSAPDGATDVEQCTCPPEFYLSEYQDTCLPCKDGLLCPGGDGDPYVLGGYYAEKKMKGEMFDDLDVWRCTRNNENCPGETVKIPGQRDLINVRLIGVCVPAELAGNGPECSRCAEGFFYEAEECVECQGGQSAMFPLFVIAIFLVMFIVYHVVENPKNQQLSAGLMLSCLGGLLINLCQILGVMSSYKVDFPVDFRLILDFASIFLFDIGVLRAGCVLGTGFESRFYGRVLTPVILFGMFFMLFVLMQGVHKVVPKIKAMELDKTLNTIGLLTNVAYISLCTSTIEYFKKQEHPSAPAVVRDYPDVEWQSAEHNAAAGIAGLMVAVYIVGVMVLFMYLCYISPSKSTDPDFRMRTKFLVARWKPTRWYYGLVVMIRNLLLAMVSILSPAPGCAELAITATIIGIYAQIAMYVKPWRAGFLNMTDGLLSMLIMLICVFAMCVADYSREDEQATRTSRFGGLLVFLIVTAFISLVFALGRAAYFALNQKQYKRSMEDAAAISVNALMTFSEALQAKMDSGTTAEQIEKSIVAVLTSEEMTETVRYMALVLNELFAIVLQDQKGNAVMSRRLQSKNEKTPGASQINLSHDRKTVRNSIRKSVQLDVEREQLNVNTYVPPASPYAGASAIVAPNTGTNAPVVDVVDV